MNHGITSQEDLFECFMADQPEEMDDSFLELLCEDGFLDISDLCEEDFPLSDEAGRIVKRSNVLQIWNDVAKQVPFLRAPPYFV